MIAELRAIWKYIWDEAGLFSIINPFEFWICWYIIIFCLLLELLLYTLEFYVVNLMYFDIIGVFIQAKIAILAIIIAMAIISIQLYASNYTPRTVVLFRKNVSMYSIITVFFISIIIDAIILGNNIQDKFWVNFSFYITIGLLFTLILWIRILALSLELPMIYRILIKDIKMEDPWTITPVFDIIISCISKNDYYLAKKGLTLLQSEKIGEIIEYKNNEKSKESQMNEEIRENKKDEISGKKGIIYEIIKNRINTERGKKEFQYSVNFLYMHIVLN